jgi:hypothetical protein
LKEENAQLKEEVARSSAENACWRERVDRLREENGRLREENFHLGEGDANANLKEDNARLRQKLRLQEPLVSVGVCIRRRFLEKARQERWESLELESMTSPGNNAAHAGDLAADVALFELGYMKGFDPFPNTDSGSETKEKEQERAEVGEGDEDEEMEDGYEIGEYGFEYHFESRYKNLCKELYGDEFEHWQEENVWGGREREVRDMTATMASSCGNFFAGETESGDSNFDRFNVLVEELNRFKCLIDEQCSTREERVKMFEESEEVGARLGQMRGIVKETSHWAFRHMTCGGKKVEMALSSSPHATPEWCGVHTSLVGVEVGMDS